MDDFLINNNKMLIDKFNKNLDDYTYDNKINNKEIPINVKNYSKIENDNTFNYLMGLLKNKREFYKCELESLKNKINSQNKEINLLKSELGILNN